VIILNIQEAIRSRILELMAERDLTISELSRRAELRQSTVNSIIKGEVKSPTVQSTLLIAKAMGLSLDQFFNSPHFRNINTDDLNKKSR
jgi:transcriptional regulator with XRE-family HTH domain